MKKYRILAVLMTLMITFTFMPSFAFAETADNPSDREAKLKMMEENESEEEESIKAGELIVRDYDRNIFARGDEAVEWAKENGVAYPVKIEFTAASGVELQGEYFQYYVFYDSLYSIGNKFTVTYDDDTVKEYICTEDGYWLDGDASTDDWGWFSSVATGSEGVFLDGQNSAVLTMYEDVLDDYYTIEMASDEVEVSLIPVQDTYVDITDEDGSYYGTYSGKAFDITTESVEVYPNYNGIPEVLEVKPKDTVKSIGTHEIVVTIDNSNNYYKDDTLTGYFSIYPKAVTGLKVTNTKKNTITVSWKYTDKTNYKQIDGYLVSVYDSNYNFITEKKVKKSKTSVTLKSKKLKKGKKYSVEIAAYKDVDGSDYRSETIDKIVKVKK